MKLKSISDISFAWPMLGHLISVLGQFGLMKIVAMLGGKSLFGQFALVLALVAAANMLIFGPFTQWAMRDFQDAKENGKLKDYFYTVYKNCALAGVIFFVLVLIFYVSLTAVFAIDLGIGWNLLILGAILGVGVALNDLIFSLLNVARYPGLSALLTSLDSLLKLVVVGIISIYAEFTLESIVIGLIVTQLVIIVSGYSIMRVRIAQSKIFEIEKTSETASELQKNMFSYTWPFLIWAFFGYLATMGDKWVLANNVTSAELGVYSAMALASLGLANAITTAVNKGVIPVVFRVAGSGQLDSRKQKASYIVNMLVMVLSVFFTMLIILSLIFPDYIITFFASSEFTSHKEYLWLLMTAAAAVNIAQCLITHGLIGRSPVIYLPSKIFHGVVVLLGLLWFVPKMGLPGAIYVILAGNILQLLMILAVNRKYAGATK